jgi:glycine cleavage system transcriptional repressor
MSKDRQLKVLTAIGSDRPGLVRGISATVRRSGANIEDSRMAVLGGEFAIIMLCAGSAEQLAMLERESVGVARELALEISFKVTSVSSAREFLAYRLRVSGIDHPGIVESVTQILAEREVNVASMDTRVVHMPLTGTPTFELDAAIEVPAGTSPSELSATLAGVADKENLELSLEPSSPER